MATGGTGVGYAVASTEVGVAIEATKATPVAPTFWLPVKAPKYTPDLMLLPDETLQGSMVKVYDLVEGMRYDKHGWESYPYLDSFPVLLRCLLGGTDHLTAAPTTTTLASPATAGATTVTTTGSIATGSWISIGTGNNTEVHLTTGSTGTTVTLVIPLINNQPSLAPVTGLTKHQFSLLNNSPSTGNQPPSLTITDFDGEEWRQVAAAQLDELTIKGNNTGLVTYTCTFLGNPAITPSPPTPSFTGTHTVNPWTMQPYIAGAFVPGLQDWEFSFKRGTTPIPALTGTQAYFEYFANVLECTGKFSFVEQSGSPQITQYLNGTKQIFDFTVFDVQDGSALNIHSTASQFSTAELDRSKEYVVVPVDFQMLPTSTDALNGGVSPVILTAANAQTTSY